MGGPHIEALRISPKYTSDDWYDLSIDQPSDWDIASDIVNDRLNGRFLQYADMCMESPHSGFVVLSINCLLIETLQQFVEGVIDGRGQSSRLFQDYLKGAFFQPFFDHPARVAFYRDIRCGLLHQAEAREMWLLRRDQDALLSRICREDGYILDVSRFHNAVRSSLEEYLDRIRMPENAQLRRKLWQKMDSISNTRAQRGALLTAD